MSLIQLQVLVGEFQGTYFFDDFQTVIKGTETSWLGATNTDWATNSNWDLGVPESSSNAFIPSGLSNYPVVSEITAAVVNNLTVENTASLSIENGGSLIVNGASTGK